MALDEEALTSLVRAELPAVYSISFRLCGNTTDAETLCQMIFSAARRHQPDMPLLKIVVQEWKTFSHQSKKKAATPDPRKTDAPTRTLNALSADERIVLTLRDVVKKPLNETATLLGISESSAKSRLAHARESFRQAGERIAAAKR